MTERRYKAAAAEARKALAVNPNSIPALSYLAAAQLRDGDAAGSQETQAKVAAISPRPAYLHYPVGVLRAMGRQYEDAEPQFKKAIEMAPAWPAPRTELGLMYMETGQ